MLSIDRLLVYTDLSLPLVFQMMHSTIFAYKGSIPNQGMGCLILLTVNAVFVEGIFQKLFEELSDLLWLLYTTCLEAFDCFVKGLSLLNNLRFSAQLQLITTCDEVFRLDLSMFFERHHFLLHDVFL